MGLLDKIFGNEEENKKSIFRNFIDKVEGCEEEEQIGAEEPC